MATPSRPGASAAARRPSSTGSARHASKAAASKPARPAPAAHDASTAGDDTPTGRISKGSARVARADGSSARPVPTRVGKSGGMGVGFYAVIALIVLVLVGVFSVGPIRRTLALSSLDSFKSDGANPAALAAADSFLDLIGERVSHVTSAIYSDRGPVEAQVYLAKKRALFSSLVQIADRPLASEATGRATVTVEQRVLAMQAAVEVYNSDKHGNDLLPDHITDWVKDSAGSRDLALASMALMVKAKTKNTSDLLHQVAMTADADPLRVKAAMDGLAELADVSNLGFLIGLLTGPSGDLALQRPLLTGRIVALATPDHLPRLMELFGNPKDQVRAIAIDALGGPGMRMGDNAADLRKREDLGKTITPKLTMTTPPVELAAAIRAVRGLRLFGARDAMLELAKDIDSLHLDGIDKTFMAEVLGKSLISTMPEPAPPKDGKPSEDDKIAVQVRRYSDDLITKLTAGLEDPKLMPTAALALGHIRDKSYLHLRDAVDKLAAHGEDEGCMDSLILIVNKTYARDDVSKQCGRSKEKWEKFLAADRPRFERIKGIVDWIAENGKYQRISDGKERLAISRDYIVQAQADLNAMISEKNFIPPMGLTRQRIDSVMQDTNMLGKNVKSAWSGALE